MFRAFGLAFWGPGFEGMGFRVLAGTCYHRIQAAALRRGL